MGTIIYTIAALWFIGVLTYVIVDILRIKRINKKILQTDRNLLLIEKLTEVNVIHKKPYKVADNRTPNGTLRMSYEDRVRGYKRNNTRKWEQ